MPARNATKNIVENVNGDELASRLLGAIDPSHRLRVTVEDMDAQEARGERLLSFAGAMQSRNTSVDEAVERIRALRDEEPNAEE